MLIILTAPKSETSNFQEQTAKEALSYLQLEKAKVAEN